jgi:hypothetical protein
MLWEEHDFPASLSDVVDALIALPPERCIDSKVIVPVVLRDAREGVVYGARFRMVGTRSDYGGEWEAILYVDPMDAR